MNSATEATIETLPTLMDTKTPENPSTASLNAARIYWVRISSSEWPLFSTWVLMFTRNINESVWGTLLGTCSTFSTRELQKYLNVFLLEIWNIMEKTVPHTWQSLCSVLPFCGFRFTRTLSSFTPVLAIHVFIELALWTQAWSCWKRFACFQENPMSKPLSLGLVRIPTSTYLLLNFWSRKETLIKMFSNGACTVCWCKLTLISFLTFMSVFGHSSVYQWIRYQDR